MSLSRDEIEESLRLGSPRKPGRHIRIEPPVSKREVRYAVAGGFAALIAGVMIAGFVA